jgi:hypothetical protein
LRGDFRFVSDPFAPSFLKGLRAPGMIGTGLRPAFAVAANPCRAAAASKTAEITTAF